MKVIEHVTKTLTTRDNGRSSDAVSPNFLYGCLGSCMKSYCYVGRYNHDKVYVNKNVDEILFSISAWADKQPWPKKPNQVDDMYYCIDIGCSTDVPLMRKHYDWQVVFDYFNSAERVKSTFATKYPTRFDPTEFSLRWGKHRLRVSLMPQSFSNVLESKTDKIEDRIKALKYLSEYIEVHINFSPIIYHEDWLKEYAQLFQQVKESGVSFKSECIFLTHNELQHNRNSEDVQELLWKPSLQENKNSFYADGNIRYKVAFKAALIAQFKQLYSKYFPLSTIRYIF